MIFTFISLSQFFHAKRDFSYTAVECGWVGITSISQIGAAISSTINVSAACHPSSDLSVCASTVLLVPSTWFSSILAYFLALFVSIMTHKSLYPDIWKRTIFEIEWFGDRLQEPPCDEKIVQNFLLGNAHLEEDPYRDYYEDIESTATRKKQYPIRDSIEGATPLGAVKIRRGIDHPFARPMLNQSFPTLQKVALPLPSLPARNTASQTWGSRYLEKFRDSNLLIRSENPLQYSKHYHAPKPSFPPSIPDVDKPIPLPELSEWVRAESAL
ncbi:hypothetical protein CPB84DRAFT_887186 [Gymnopilus junonius]|uniref:Uncharacterized protein n=1 Tax=Gymnopilus junonius TaxID=109634 RepID=A0A9P5NQC4_GYMJU|nr:hypothetical protein CPB84DRAFT_887186 [Gymnopilus junonius]